MSKKIKAVDIADEVANEEPKAEDVIETVEEKPKEDIIEEETMEDAPRNNDINVDEIIKEEESKKPKPSRKMVSCPDCGKTMLEKNFRYQTLSVCGKVKQPKLRAKPI
jgi:DNA-directed RNA polymerase subunit M/transcription elongation factor TFIIS